jgi:hypothetical protein
VLTRAKKHFWTTIDVKDFQSKQSFQSYGQLKKFIDGWVPKKKMFLSTEITICHAQVFYIQRANCKFRPNYLILMYNTHRVPLKLHTHLLTKIAESLIKVTCFPNLKCHVSIWLLVFCNKVLAFYGIVCSNNKNTKT